MLQRAMSPPMSAALRSRKFTEIEHILPHTHALHPHSQATKPSACLTIAMCTMRISRRRFTVLHEQREWHTSTTLEQNEGMLRLQA